MTLLVEQITLRIVALLLVLELISVSFLWTLNPLTREGETTFAIFLALDLVAFAMISYTYRTKKRGESIGRAPLIAGCSFALLLLFAGLLLS